MPLYEYRCSACEHQFEVIQSFSDKPVRKCEQCGGRVRKLVSRSGFLLKGGGWYKSDYGSSGKSKGGRGGDAAAGSGEASSTETASPPAAASGGA